MTATKQAMARPLAFSQTNRTPGTAEVLAGIDLAGALAVVTGASGGIGVAMAAALARAGADVVLAARPGAKLDAAVASVAVEAREKVEGIGIDLADLNSVDAFADAVLAKGRPLDILINNAGIIGPKALSSIGVEMGFMTNVVGHAVLASRLSPALRDGGRIACVSSFGHHYSPVVFDDINFDRRPYSAWSSYGQSKTGCILLALKLSRALAHRGIDAFSMHPGAILTDMSRSMIQEDFDTVIEKSGAIIEYLTPDQGAATTIWSVTAPQLAGMGGLYLQECAVAEVREELDYRTGVMPYAIDPDLAERLWDTVRDMSGRQSLPLL